jgi:hypothetical protein
MGTPGSFAQLAGMGTPDGTHAAGMVAGVLAEK